MKNDVPMSLNQTPIQSSASCHDLSEENKKLEQVNGLVNYERMLFTSDEWDYLIEAINQDDNYDDNYRRRKYINNFF